MGIKISQLPTTLAATPADLLEAVQGGVSIQITAQMLIDLVSATASPTGVVQAFAGATVPTGWFLCDGSTKVKATYPALYAAIGDAFGSDTLTFNVPDLRGEFIRGLDASRGVDTGRVLGSSQVQAIQSHTHSLNLIQGVLQSNGNSNTNEGVWGTGATGSTGGTETRPRNVALNYIIKY